MFITRTTATAKSDNEKILFYHEDMIRFNVHLSGIML